MICQYLTDINAKNCLIAQPHRIDERSNEAKISPSMSATLVGGTMCRSLTSSEIGYRERVHIADDLAVRKMKACLTFANEGSVRNHGEGGCSSRRELDIDHLWH